MLAILILDMHIQIISLWSCVSCWWAKLGNRWRLQRLPLHQKILKGRGLRDEEIMNSEALKNKFRAVLKARGLGTLPLLTIFRQFDLDGSGELSWEGNLWYLYIICIMTFDWYMHLWLFVREEFCQAFKHCNLAATQQEIRALFLELDEDGSGEVSFNEFIHGMRGEMSLRRRQFLIKLFRSIDR